MDVWALLATLTSLIAKGEILLEQSQGRYYSVFKKMFLEAVYNFKMFVKILFVAFIGWQDDWDHLSIGKREKKMGKKYLTSV